jgi:transposase
MRIAPVVMLTEEQRKQLEANVRGRSLPARLVERSRIVLLADDGACDSDIAAALNITPHKAALWRSRFLELGLAGLEKDAARPGRPALISTAKIQAVVTKTTQELPPNATQWSTRTMAAATGLSEASVRRRSCRPSDALWRTARPSVPSGRRRRRGQVRSGHGRCG